MISLRLTLAAAALAGVMSTQSAYALSFDHSSDTNADGSAKFDDPDDNIPFPHVADDGSQAGGNYLQGQTMGNSGASFGFMPPQNEPDAFTRAQERMQQ